MLLRRANPFQKQERNTKNNPTSSQTIEGNLFTCGVNKRQTLGLITSEKGKLETDVEDDHRRHPHHHHHHRQDGAVFENLMMIIQSANKNRIRHREKQLRMQL